MTEQKSWIKRIENLDRRILYLLIMVPVSIPLVIPLGIPLPVTARVTEFYNIILSLPEDSVVVIDFGFTLGEWGTCGQGAIPVMKMLAGRPDLKLIFLQLTVEEEIVIGKIVNEMPVRFAAREYGEDWIMLMYLSGGGTALSGIADDMWHTSPFDGYGTPLSELPIMADVRSAEDWDLLINFSNTATRRIITQVSERYEVPILTMSATLDEVELMPYYTAGQLEALVTAERDAAQFELLINEPGVNISKMDASNIGSIVFLCLVYLANISYLLGRSQRERS